MNNNCHKCQKPYQSNTRFCAYCGTELKINSANLSTTLVTKQIESIATGIDIETTLIVNGKFWMGSISTQHYRIVDSSFYIGTYPITQQQYEAVMRLNPASHRGDNLPIEGVSYYDAVSFCTKLSNITQQRYRLPSEAEWEYCCRARVDTIDRPKILSLQDANFENNKTTTSRPIPTQPI
ncbi:MAG: SUMF1/EgtB/PvdO family nonheme iron enzyme [Chamaesiphon sp. CSU_1_12]|nr:SUMF1/EgtB/PvdO family nonheme iron enzyme [Chamaesiphon sp. CSU_1_12]